jgi:hypothetical protein
MMISHFSAKGKQFNLLTLVAFQSILLTVAFSMISFNELRLICVCISNWLAWAWIALGLTVLLGLLANPITLFFTPKAKILLFLLVLQELSLAIGLILLIIFGGLLIRVW